MFKYLIILLSSVQIFSAPNPSWWRMELSSGYYKLDYSETVTNTSRVPTSGEQSGIQLNGRFQWMIFPTWLVTELDIDYTGNAMDTNVSTPLSLLEITGKITALTPLFLDERVGFGVTGSYIYLNNLTPTSNFSLQSNEVMLAYPEIYLFPTGFEKSFNYQLYGNISLFKVKTQRTDLTLGVRFFFPTHGHNAKYPVFSYNKGLILNIEYNKADIEYGVDATRKQQFEIERLMVSLGFSF